MSNYKTPIIKALAENIKARGLTQKEIADAIGVTLPTIGKLLKGKFASKLPNIEAIADMMGLQLALVPKGSQNIVDMANNIYGIMVQLINRDISNSEAYKRLLSLYNMPEVIQQLPICDVETANHRPGTSADDFSKHTTKDSE